MHINDEIMYKMWNIFLNYLTQASNIQEHYQRKDVAWAEGTAYVNLKSSEIAAERLQGVDTEELGPCKIRKKAGSYVLKFELELMGNWEPLKSPKCGISMIICTF